MAANFRNAGGCLFRVPTQTELEELFTGGGTVMAWIRLDSFGGSSFGRIVDQDSLSGVGWAILVDDSISIEALGFTHIFTTSGLAGWFTDSNTLSLDTWHHVAVAYNNSSTANNPIMYIDGESVNVNEGFTPTGTASTGATDLIIGNRLDETRSFDGDIADIRLYNRILADTEIQHIYASLAKDNILFGLVSRWPMRDGNLGVVPGSKAVESTEQFAGTATQITITVPTDVQNGDLMVLAVSSGGNGSGTPSTINTPAGWTQRITVSAPATASTPRITVFDRMASSEPATYIVTINQTAALAADLVIYRGPTNTTTTTGSNTGTTSSPISPSVVAGGKCTTIRAFVADASVMPTPQIDIHPPNTRGRDATFVTGGGNGCTMAICDHQNNSGAVGTATWNITATEQWAAVTINYESGDVGNGPELLPLVDISNNAFHGEAYGTPTIKEDILRK